jgi:serine protease DegQ
MMARHSVLAAARAFGAGCGIAAMLLLLTHCSEPAPPGTPSPPPGAQAPQAPAIGTPAPAGAERSPPPQLSFHEAASKAMPSVVNIFTAKRLRSNRPALPEGGPFERFFGAPRERPQTATSLGSGVVVSRDGLILTNNHVIEGADQIAVVLEGSRQASARVVGTDPDTDLAVIKADADNLTPITYGSSDAVKVGDIVLAIGDPFGVGQTVTMGIVSATGRNRLGINPIENFIQTDAPINPGNSGGALVDSRGALIGINTAIFSESGGSLGIGFAIPVSMVKPVVEQLMRTGRVSRGWLGVQVEDLTPDRARQIGLSEQTGALIAGVLPRGPAQRAGVRPGDVVRSISGKPVADAAALLVEITALSPGQQAELAIVREGQELRVPVRVAERPPPARAIEQRY